MKPSLLISHLLFLAALAFLPGRAAADSPDLLTRLVAQLSEPAVVQAEFVQEKQLAALTRPLISRGRITVSRRDGVLWQMDSPIRMSVAFGAAHIVEVDAEGRRRVRDLGENRAQAEAGRIFRGLLAADMDSLRRYFELEAQGDLQHWRINLRPRSQEVSLFIKGMQLSGGKHIEGIRVDEAGGDSTIIRLRNIKTRATLTPDERALFAAS